MSNTSGSVAGNNNLWGLDFGIKLSNGWQNTCSSTQLQLNGYVEGKIAIANSDNSYGDVPSMYALQLTVAPGIRTGNFSIDCGPYLAYSAFSVLDEEDISSILEAEASGIDFGLRLGFAVLLESVELGLHYDIGLSDMDKKFKKNDLLFSIGFKFKN